MGFYLCRNGCPGTTLNGQNEYAVTGNQKVIFLRAQRSVYVSFTKLLVRFITKHVCDRQTDRQTDRQKQADRRSDEGQKIKCIV